MENQEVKPNQYIVLKDRKVLEVDGVKKLDSFDEKEFLIDTVNGYVHVKGNNLALGTMDMEKGFISILGNVDSFAFLAKSKSEKKESFFSKIFK